MTAPAGLVDTSSADLARAAAALFEEARRRARRRRRRQVALGAAALLVALAVVSALVLPHTGRRGPLRRGAAPLAYKPGNDLVFLSYATDWYSGGRLYRRTTGQLWYTARRARTIGTNLSMASGRPVEYLEVAATAHRLRSYESSERTLTTQVNCRGTGAFPHPWTNDPVANFAALQAQHRLTPGGTTMFEGRSVRQLLATVDQNQLTYLLPANSRWPLAMTVTPAATAGLQTPATFTGTLVRFRAHSRAALDPGSGALLNLNPHRAATVTRLGRRFC